MSSVSLNIEVTFNSNKDADLFHMFLSGYDSDGSQENSFEKEKKLLALLKLDGDKLFSSSGTDSQISNVSMSEYGTIQFYMEGGVHGGYEFWQRLQKLFLDKKPASLYAVILNDQVYEYELQVYDGKILKAYCTGDDSGIDEKLFERLEEEDQIEVLKDYCAQNKLPLEPVSQSEVSAADLALGLDILQDEEQFNMLAGVFLIKGFVLFLVLFLIGWLALGYLWTSLVCSLMIGFSYFIKNYILINKAKEEYNSDKQEMVDELKDMGVSDEKAEQMVGTMESVMTKAVKHISENE